MISLCVSGFSDALDWRHCFFQEPVVEQSACALCRVVSRKAVRLSCTHLLCAECHQMCILRGSACPLDGECFADDSIVRLDVSKGYIEKRTVACWNAPHGCDFVCPTSSLLEHYRQCSFHIVPCTRCHSSVLRSEIVDHYKYGCSMSPPTTPAHGNDPTIPDHGEIEKTGKELLEAVLKITEDLHCLHTILNLRLEDVRAADWSTKELFKSQSSTLSELFAKLGVACSENFELARNGLSEVASDLGEVRKTHTSRELCAQSRAAARVARAPSKISSLAGTSSPPSLTQANLTKEGHPRKQIPAMDRAAQTKILINFQSGRVTFDWFFEGWTFLKSKAFATGKECAEGPLHNAHGYRVSQQIELYKHGDDLVLYCFLNVFPSEKESMRVWRFGKSLTVGFVHARDKERKIEKMFNTSRDNPSFERQKSGSRLFAFALSSISDQLENEGFIKDDKLQSFVQIQPYVE